MVIESLAVRVSFLLLPRLLISAPLPPFSSRPSPLPPHSLPRPPVLTFPPSSDPPPNLLIPPVSMRATLCNFDVREVAVVKWEVMGALVPGKRLAREAAGLLVRPLEITAPRGNH